MRVQLRVKSLWCDADAHADLLKRPNPFLPPRCNAHDRPLHAPCRREQENTGGRGSGGRGGGEHRNLQLVKHRMGQRALQCLDQAQLLRNCVCEDGWHVTYDAAVEGDGQGVQGGGDVGYGQHAEGSEEGGDGCE